MKNLTKNTLILGLMVVLLPFTAIGQGRNYGNGTSHAQVKYPQKQYHQHYKPAYHPIPHSYGYMPYPAPRHNVHTHGHNYMPAHRMPQPQPYRAPRHNRSYGMQVVVFNNLQHSLNQIHFDNQKMDMAKIAITHNGANTSQVILLMQNLSFESNKLELAKFAYDYVIDPNEYFRVVESLTFYSSRNALMDYIQ